MKNKYLVLLLLTLPPVFCSALIAPIFFAPLRVPFYLIAAIIAGLMMARHMYRFIVWPAVLSLCFFFLLLVSAIFNSVVDSAVVYRQCLYQASLFFCSYIGYLVVFSAANWKINYSDILITMFIILFAYGIYTYFAQIFELYEFLWFLRPSPSIRFLEPEQIYSQGFHGALNRYRAYSVWYEPSYVSLVMACALPLLFLCRNKKIKIYYLLLAAGFTFLTYSRSTWLVYIIFLCIYLWSNTTIKLPLWLPYLILLFGIPLSLFAGFSSIMVETDISALIRFYNNMQALTELTYYPWAMVIGLGSPDLINPPIIGSTISAHITSAFVAILHWLGILGLLFLMFPFAMLLNKAKYCDAPVYCAIVSFVSLTLVSLNLGGNFFGLSLLWFFFGVYYAFAERAGIMRKVRLANLRNRGLAPQVGFSRQDALSLL